MVYEQLLSSFNAKVRLKVRLQMTRISTTLNKNKNGLDKFETNTQIVGVQSRSNNKLNQTLVPCK